LHKPDFTCATIPTAEQQRWSGDTQGRYSSAVNGCLPCSKQADQTLP